MDLSTYNPPLGTRPVSNPSHPYRAAKHTRPHSVRAPGVLATALMGIVLSIGCGGAAVRDTSGLSCATAGCDPMATCSVSSTQVMCACPAGFVDINGDGKACVDKNECALANPCSQNAVCTNTLGSYECACKTGFVGDGAICVDLNECLFNNGGCSPNADCTNTPGSRVCTCNKGFQGDGVVCTDINECANANGGCDMNATCTNTQGSRVCACAAGFQGNGETCMDIDECASRTARCDSTVACTNTLGSYKCGDCPAGYLGGGASGCVDINECLSNNGGCDANATCTNTPGGHTCACKAGYTGSGTRCGVFSRTRARVRAS